MKTPIIARVQRRMMGVSCEVTVRGLDSSLVAHSCLDHIAEYEQLWSRFIGSSDISRLNHAHGEPVWVNEKTIHLVSYLQAAHIATRGLFNPTLLPLQLAAGDVHSLVDEKISTVAFDSFAQPTMDNVQILDDGRVQLLNGTTLDAGGLAKGLAADMVLEHALSMGAAGACINIGGDLAIHTGSEEAWPIDIMSPLRSSEPLDTVLLSSGGVATSAINARHRNGSVIENHIFTTGGTTTSHTVGATVLASHAAWAEAWTKFAILAEPSDALHTIAENGLAALLVLDDGTQITTDSWKDLSR